MITVEVNAVIVEAPEDIFFQGNYVVSEKGNVVQVSSKKGDSVEEFAGQLVKVEPGYVSKEGHFSTRWRKQAFEQFVGTIVITSK